MTGTEKDMARVTTPSWGNSPERYEAAAAEMAYEMGWEDVRSPTVAQVADGERVLDLGCGTGHTARLLSERGCSVVGVEFDERAAVAAGAWCERVVVGDLDLLRLDQILQGETFDVVVAGDILEHLRDPGAVLRTLIPLLGETGRVVASVPNIAHGSIRLALLGGTFEYAEWGILDRTHLRFFTRASLERLFEAAGYVIDRNERLKAGLEHGVPWDAAVLPAGISEVVSAMPEATTFAFLVVAHPHPDARAATAPSAGAESTNGGAKDNGNGSGGAPGPAKSIVSVEADILRDRDREIARLRGRIAENAAMRAQLDRIHDSLPWRVWTRVRPLVRAGRTAAHRLTSGPAR